MTQPRWMNSFTFGTVSLFLGLLVSPPASRAEQFVLFDVTFTYTKEDADNSKPSKSHYYVRDQLNPNRPKDWTSPVDYRNGTVHIRTEILEKPAGGEPTTWSLCYIPNKGQKNGYGCTGTKLYREPGVYEQDVSMKSFWENESIIWSEGIKQMDLVIKDGSGGAGHAHKRADHEKFFPTKVRITMVQVSAGAKYDPALVPNLTDKPATAAWKWSPDLMRPFWQGAVVEGESVLFIKDAATGQAKASVLFPVQQVRAVRNSAGDVTYEEGRDYVWKPESREIMLPVGSRIPSRTPQELRRPEKSQPYALTHRDGNGEIFFGGKLEYAEMQTCITYSHAPNLWKSAVPKFDATVLPRTVDRLRTKQPLSIVVLGDSISAGANASALYAAAPNQPAYPELLRQHLEARFGGPVALKNLAVGGKDTAWGVTQVASVAEAQPQLVILAFGMNDVAGRTVEDYKAKTQQTIAGVRERLPDAEFILVASMLGNRDWVRLKHELFPAYRDALRELCGPGVALADLTAVWTEFLKLKQDWDQTGNGVNHPNDFGHRMYAQVIAALLTPAEDLDGR